MVRDWRVGKADRALAVPVEPVSRLDPSGFDPSRVGELAKRASALLACDHRANRPNPRVSGERIVGFVIDENDIGMGLSEPLLALRALVELARHAIAMEARQGGDGETRLHAKHDSAGPQDIAPSPQRHQPPRTRRKRDE